MRIAAAGILLLSCATLAGACSVVRTSCAMGDRSPVVFVGTVVAPDDPPTEALLHDSPAIFEVTERFRGNVGKQISIYGPRTSCAYAFTKGKSYVVFAYFENGRLTTSELSSTRPTWRAGAFLRQLRAISQGQQPVSLFGYLGDGGPTRELPMAGITVRARSKRGTFTAQSGADGSFEFKKLPPGVYKIKPDFPKGYAPNGTVGQVSPGESCDVESVWAFRDDR